MITGLRDLLFGLLLLLAVAAGTWSVIHSDSAVASRVYIAGALDQASANRIATTIAPYLGVPFFDVDIEAVAARLDTLPWLAGVSVDRRWPDGVVIHVTDRQPLALWGADQVLTADFAVVAPRPGVALPRLPQLVGPDGTGERVYARFVHMNQQLAAGGNRHIVALELNARGAWIATLADGLELRFGRDHLALRLQRFINYALTRLPRALASAGYVDLRYSDGFAVGGVRATAVQEKGNEQKA